MTDNEILHNKVVKAQLRYYRLRNILTFFGLSTVVATLVVSLMVFFNISNVIDETKSNTQQLIDCTTPKHTCYEQARSATSGAVGTIAKVVVAASYCEKNLAHGTSAAVIQDCVNKVIGVK